MWIGLLHFARNDGEWVAGLLYFVRNDREWGLDCFISLAMTGGGGAGLSCFARNDGRRGDWIATLRSQ